MLARLFVLFGGLLVLALCAALVGPYFIDWTSYRADFEREAGNILGRKVTVQGDATARLLPFPSVTFTNVAVAGGPYGQPAMTVETFSMDAELAPLLRGEVLIYDMRLERPRATIEIAADGAIDWTMRPSAPFDASQISIENLSVTDGQVTLRHAAGGRSHRISEINATVSAKSLAGPWRMDGSLRFDGMLTQVAASTGKVEDGGQMRLKLRLDPDEQPVTIEADGDARINKGAALYSGEFKISEARRSATGARVTSEAGKADAGKEDPGYRVNGKFALDHRRLGIDQFRFETGPLNDPYTADGKATVDLGAEPRFAVEADGAQVQFDDALGDGARGALTLPQRIAVLENALLDLPKPAIPGTIEVNLPAIVAGDTTVRDVHLSAEPAAGGWTLKSVAATLPGRARLEANGLLGVDKEFRFTGSLLLAVAQPSGFAAWLSRDVDEAIRRLPAAGFKADVDLTDKRQVFSNLELILGKAKFHGAIDSGEPDDARPSMAIKLAGGELDVDGLTAFASLFVSDKGDNRFSDRDLDFQIKAGPVTAAGLTAETLDTALRLRQGALEIDRLAIGGLAGASISATGRVKDFPQSPTGNLDASVVAVDLAPLIAVAAESYPDSAVLKGLAARTHAYPSLFQDARLDVVTSAAENDDGSTGLAVSAHGAAGGSAFSASLSGQGRIEDLAQAPLTLTFNARNADATALMALYGVPVMPLGLVGEGTTDLSAQGTLAGGLTTTFNLSGDGFKAGFAGTLADTPQGPTAKGKVSIDAADIEPWLMTAGMSVPGMGSGTPAAFSAEADYGNGLLVLDGLAGTINEAAVSGDINAEIKEGAPHLSGALILDELDLEPVAAMLFGEPALAPGSGPWPDVPFKDKANAPFSAELDLTVATLSAGTLASAYDATLSLKLDPEGVSVSGLGAKMFGGEVSGLFDLKNNEGSALFSSQLKLAGADLATALPDAGIAGTGDFSASLSSSGKSVGGVVAGLSGSGTASLKGVRVSSINPDAFPALISKADAIGRDIDATQTAGFAPAIVNSGIFAAGDAELAFTVAGGTLRAPPVSLENPAATLSATIGADLNTATVSASGAVTYRPGDEALVGSEPSLNFSLEGPLGTAKPVFDSAPLAQFLTQRALEKEQQRVEAMQTALLEKQRLRREVRYYAALQDARDRAEEQRRLEEEAARQKAEAEAAARAEAQARADADAKARADAAAQAAAEAKAKADAAAEAQDAIGRQVDAAAKAVEQGRTPAPPADGGKAKPEAKKKVQRATPAPPPQLQGFDSLNPLKLPSVQP